MRKFFKKHWPLVGIGLVLAVVVFYLVEARKGAVQNPISADADPEESLKLQDIHFSQSTPDKAEMGLGRLGGQDFKRPTIHLLL